MFGFLFKHDQKYLSCLYLADNMNCLLHNNSFHRCAMAAFSEDSETPFLCLSLHFYLIL